MGNKSLPTNLRKSAFNWDAFDNSCREVRDAINYAAGRYTLTAPSHDPRMAARVISVDTEAVASAYAQRDAEQALKELGL